MALRSRTPPAEDIRRGRLKLNNLDSNRGGQPTRLNLEAPQVAAASAKDNHIFRY